jgi:uncharacterized protein YkwD
MHHVALAGALSGLVLAVGCSCTSTPTARASETTTTLASPTTTAFALESASPSPSALEAAVLQEINALRADPHGYADTLRSWQGNYRGDVLVLPGQDKAIRTTEGEAALVEAIAVLEATPAAQTMGWLDGLSRAAHDHVAAQGATRTIGHRGQDGSNSLQRISRHGKSRGRSAEVIDYGWGDAKNIVIDLLVDDGIADRGHRRALLDPLYSTAGVSCGSHARYGVMCVVEMAERFDAFPATADVTLAAAAGAR